MSVSDWGRPGDWGEPAEWPVSGDWTEVAPGILIRAYDLPNEEDCEQPVRIQVLRRVHWPAALTTQDCPDDAPDGTCWDCGAHKSRPHREDCATRQQSEV